MELLRALGSLAEAPQPEHAALAAALELGEPPEEAEHTELFVFQLPPYASIYLGAEGMLGGEARDRVAGFWRALGLTPPAEPDHLTVLLGFYAELADGAGDGTLENELRQRLDHARDAFLAEHLVPWLPLYLDRVAAIASPFYRSWASLLGDALAAQTEKLPERPELPLHLREAPPLEDPREQGGTEFTSSLLAPVRSGAIFTRADLARAAGARDLGLRQGERRYILEALMAQDAAGTLAWLADEVAARPAPGGLPAPVARFWSERRRSTSELLAKLASEALTGRPEER